MLPSQSETHSRAITIVREVADREGVDCTELPPLYNIIDPDALEALADSLAQDSDEGEIQFAYCGYQILIDSDGHVIVTDHVTRENHSTQTATINGFNKN